jgi:hypothetical protein
VQTGAFAQISSNLEVPRLAPSNFIEIQTAKASLIFSSKSVLNVKKFQ